MKPIRNTILLISLLAGTTFAQPEGDPYAPDNAKPVKNESSEDPFLNMAGLEPERPRNISIRWEIFSMPLDMAANMQRENLSDAECYKRLVGLIDKGEVKQELLAVTRSRSGEKCSYEAIVEEIHPTEHDPAYPLNEENSSGETPSSVAIPSTPTAFETRNTGETLEVETTVDHKYKYFNLRLVPEQTVLAGYSTWGQGLSLAKMPTYESRRLNTAITCEAGKPFLIGTLNRPSTSKIVENPSQSTSFAFVTVSFAH